MTERERWLRQFHDATPGCTSRAFRRGGSYELLAGMARDARSVLDLACGDGHLLEMIAKQHTAKQRTANGPSGPSRLAVGVDLSTAELAIARRTCECAVAGRAQALPFVDAAFDAVLCHLAFMLFDDIERVVDELARVLVPRGSFHAILGGGPTAHGRDAFARALELAAPLMRDAPRFGDPRARSIEGWRELFRDDRHGWTEPEFQRHELDLSGPFDDVWAFFTSSYSCTNAKLDDVAAQLAREFAGATVECRAVVWLATVTKPE